MKASYKPQNLFCNTIDRRDENEFIKEFPDVFTGQGCLKGELIKIKLKGVTPFHLSAPRHIAIPMLDKVKEEIQKWKGWVLSGKLITQQNGVIL